MRFSRLLLPSALALIAAVLIAQNGRDSYRQAYETWMQAQANIERDSGTEGDGLIPRIDRAAAAAASFQSVRAAYFKSAIQAASQRRQALQTAATTVPREVAPPAMGQLVTAELQLDNRTITRFAEDKDRGIQQLRQSLERERDTLAALNSSIQAREKSMAAASAASDALEKSRKQAAGAFTQQASQANQVLESLDREAAAWSDYFGKLTGAIRAANTPPPPTPAVTEPAPQTTSITPVPLARYVGSWTFPMTNGLFHGLRPESVDLVVQEDNGHAAGTLYARFRLPPGSAVDPAVRFDFQGDFGPAMNQRFPIVSSDGTQGTIELIPGPAFNLLEVNFQAAPRPNKIATGNFILVKK